MPIARKPSQGGGGLSSLNLKLNIPAGETLPAGSVVCIVRDTVGNVTELRLADATESLSRQTLGFAANQITTGNTGALIVLRGSLVVPVVEGGGTLTPNEPVFLSETAGEVTQTPPQDSTTVIFELGHAVSTTEIVVTTDFRGVVA